MDKLMRKIKRQMEAWKKHDAFTHRRLMTWFDVVVVQCSFKGLPDVDVHLALNPVEYKLMKQNVVTVRRELQ